jgi:hypothetical protein
MRIGKPREISRKWTPHCTSITWRAEKAPSSVGGSCRSCCGMPESWDRLVIQGRCCCHSCIGDGASLETGKLLALPDTLLGTAFSNGLYIRHEYWALFGIIQNALASFKATRRVLVVGSPEIGKSVWVFLLLLLMTEKKDVAYCPLGQSCIYYFNRDVSGGYTVSDTPCAGKVYEGFFGGSKRDGAVGFARSSKQVHPIDLLFQREGEVVTHKAGARRGRHRLGRLANTNVDRLGREHFWRASPFH